MLFCMPQEAQLSVGNEPRSLRMWVHWLNHWASGLSPGQAGFYTTDVVPVAHTTVSNEQLMEPQEEKIIQVPSFRGQLGLRRYGMLHLYTSTQPRLLSWLKWLKKSQSTTLYSHDNFTYSQMSQTLDPSCGRAAVWQWPELCRAFGSERTMIWGLLQ